MPIEAKMAAAKEAAKWIEEGMIVGLGSGTTAALFIEELSHRVKEGLNIKAVASSEASRILAEEGKISVIHINEVSSVDITVDGADELDGKMRMIKGKGGALLREKILASISKELIIVIDETKCVETIGACGLPIEVVPYGCFSVKKKLEDKGLLGSWRINPDGSFFYSDNGNLILDLIIDPSSLEPASLETEIIRIPGVVETGFFLNFAKSVIIGLKKDKVKILR